MNIVKKHELIRPLKTMDGRELTEITLDFEEIGAQALERCEKEARTFLGKKANMSVPETNKTYLACIAARASGLTLAEIRSLWGPDYTQVCLLVQDFLLGGGSEEDEETETTSSGSGETSKPTQTPETSEEY